MIPIVININLDMKSNKRGINIKNTTTDTGSNG